MSNAENICARDGCGFHVELVMIGDTPLPAVYCGSACADYEWLRKSLASAEPSPEIAASFQHLSALERLLNGRTDSLQVGPLLGSLYGR
ncbi:hypothetical protein [Streptomyces gibsoniae]|uniref:Uncharacterized protein n=1 Tax=Streptomyces gibsoniae TaxID=3075529 RepID=A0ABU2UA27_9ACTN|nr:hypothetical protein [Streptomyces sp. DSM 41699]MDT0470010.1 hypothetical protein [Streptomyces sp. DSM 41699]